MCVCAGMCTLISWPMLGYDILSAIIAVFSYAIGSIKLLANERYEGTGKGCSECGVRV